VHSHIYSTSRGNAPSPGSATAVILLFLDEFTSNHDSSGLKINVSLGRMCNEVGRVLGIVGR